MSDEDWMPIGAIAASLVKGVAPAGGDTTDATAQTGTGGARRAHTTPSEGVGGDVVIWISFGKVGAAVPTPPPRHYSRDNRTPTKVGPPATGGLGFRLLRNS